MEKALENDSFLKILISLITERERHTDKVSIEGDRTVA
jgi:hypothetical protein